MKIKEIEQEARPREKLIKNGAETLSEAELLAIILRCGNKEKNVVELSHEIINDITNISYLKDLTLQELCKFNGIKEAKASILIACFELAKRCYTYHDNLDTFTSAEDIFKLMNPLVSNLKKEVLYTLFLDSKCRLISKKLITTGTITEVTIPIQEIVKLALKLSAFSIVIVHNHPSGDILPSKNDIDSTLNLKKSLDLMGIILLDHLIIGTNNYFSFSLKHIL